MHKMLPLPCCDVQQVTSVWRLLGDAWQHKGADTHTSL
jgi:hypothetical protein